MTEDNNRKRITRVVHCKRDDFDIYIGRPTKWGNPFIIGPDGDRTEVLKKYRVWIMENKELLDDVGSLKGKTLGCWCAPKECHGDILAELAESIEDEE